MLEDDPYAAFAEPVEAAAPKPADQQPAASPQPEPPQSAAAPDPYDGIAQAVDSVRPQAAFEQNDQIWREGKSPQEIAAYDKLTPEQKQQFIDGKLQVPGLQAPLNVDVAAQGNQEDPTPQAAPETLSGLTPEQIIAKFEARPSSARPGISDLISHGILAGTETDAGGVANAAISALTHPVDALTSKGASVADAYHAGRQDMLAAIDYARLKNPNMAMPAEIGGAILNPIGAEAKGAFGLAKVGASYGAVSGFEDSNGSLGDRLWEGGKRAVVGAVAAPVIGAVLKAPGAAYDAGKSVLSGSPSLARRIVTKAIKADENTPASVASAMTEAHRNNVPMMLADTGENARGLLAAASRSSGPARTMARDSLEERQSGLAERVVNTIERDLGPVANPHAVADALMTKANEEAGPLYREFHAQPAISSPAIDHLMSRPSMQRALNNAYRIAQEEGRDPHELGFVIDHAGNVSLNPVAIGAHGAYASARSEMDAAHAAYEAARNKAAGGGGGGDVAAAKARLDRAQEGLNGAEAELALTPREGTAATARTYSPQTLDYVKRGMDDVVETYRDKTTGRLNLDTEGGAINKTLRQYIATVDRLYPQYAPARAAYGGPVKAIEAMNQGRRALNMTADDLEARMRDMSPFDKQMFALGTRRAMAELVSSKGDSANVINALVGTGKKRAMLGRLFGDRKQFGRFVQTLDQEKEGFRTFGRAMLGSPTALNVEDDTTLKLASAAADMAVNGGLPVATAIRHAIKFGFGEVGEKTRQQVTALLSETNPTRLREVAASVRAEMAKRGLRNQDISRVAGGLGRGIIAAMPNGQRSPAKTGQ